MKHHEKRNSLLAVSLSVLLFIVIACASQEVAPMKQELAAESIPVQYAQAAPAPAPETKASSFYDMEVIPLTPAECARCHYSVFSQIRDEGGKHKIDCVQCHTVFHAYNPIKQNWNEIMPKCETCHGLIHGNKFTACASCHSNPHAPKTQMAMTPEFAKMCADCHGKVNQELQQNLSKHTQVQCAMCHHQKHGYVPSCMECHKPHSSEQTVKDCMPCHPAHSPLNISIADTVKNDVCGSCHSAVYDKIRSSTTKHGQVACVKCHHSKHKYIPQCQECHGQPHGEVVLKKFPNCLQCHIDVHDLPGKSK